MTFDSFTNYMMNLKRGWGMIFRFLFITSVGVVGYFWIDPQTLGDIPFSQLTLDHIFNNLLAVGIIIFCFRWLMSLDMKDEDETYNFWANFSGILLSVLVVVVSLIWGGWLK